MNEIPVKQEDIETIRENASRAIMAAYSGELSEIVRVQVDLAKTAKNEAVRMKAGQKIIEHIVGQPTQRHETTSRSLKIISHMNVPGMRKEEAIDTELVTEAPRLPEAPPKKISAAVSERKKSQYTASDKEQKLPEEATPGVLARHDSLPVKPKVL